MGSRVFRASIALLLAGAGCCLEVAGESAGVIATGGTSIGTGGLASSTSGGSSTGSPPTFDGGSCLIDGGLVAAGAWLDLASGSCTLCDPESNPLGWTQRGGGDACELFVSYQFAFSPYTIPVVGGCSPAGEFSHSICSASWSGATCSGSWLRCVGGFCGDAGFCETDQNLSWFNACGINPQRFNTCAEGPCCVDAGWDIYNGGGWCCGLIDGGVQPACFPSGAICYASSDCCEGLTCNGHDAVYNSDAGYGFCAPR